MAVLNHLVIKGLIDRYAGLETREKNALLSLGIFFSVFLVYLLIWSPANEYVQRSASDRDNNLGLLQYMRSSEKQARAVSGSSKTATVTGQSLLTQASGSAQRFGIKPNRLQPEGNDAISVWFDGVSFNDLAAWLQYQAQQGISVRQISIDREEAIGTVNARIILRI